MLNIYLSCLHASTDQLPLSVPSLAVHWANIAQWTAIGQSTTILIVVDLTRAHGCPLQKEQTNHFKVRCGQQQNGHSEGPLQSIRTRKWMLNTERALDLTDCTTSITPPKKTPNRSTLNKQPRAVLLADDWPTVHVPQIPVGFFLANK